jgi:hypothetical protein
LLRSQNRDFLRVKRTAVGRAGAAEYLSPIFIREKRQRMPRPSGLRYAASPAGAERSFRYKAKELSMHLRNIFVLAAAGFAYATPTAMAQEVTFTSACQEFGGGTLPEQLGDREGHAISVGNYSCRTDSGPLAGGVLTGSGIWEWDKTTAKMISNGGVVRKPGSAAAYQITEGKISLTITDGKVTGSTGEGTGIYSVAVGEAASLNGKSFSWTTNTTGPGRFQIEVKIK